MFAGRGATSGLSAGGLNFTLTQQDLAELIGVAKSSIGAWELGKRPCPLKVRAKIQARFGAEATASGDGTDQT